MSGIGFSELVVLFVIGLLILGPERLPRVATQIGRWVGRARRTANQLRYQLEREITLADIDAKTDKKPKKRTQSKSSDTGVAGSEQREAKDASPKDSEPDTAPRIPNLTPAVASPASNQVASRTTRPIRPDGRRQTHP